MQHRLEKYLKEMSCLVPYQHLSFKHFLKIAVVRDISKYYIFNRFQYILIEKKITFSGIMKTKQELLSGIKGKIGQPHFSLTCFYAFMPVAAKTARLFFADSL